MALRSEEDKEAAVLAVESTVKGLEDGLIEVPDEPEPEPFPNEEAGNGLLQHRTSASLSENPGDRKRWEWDPQ